MTASSIGADVDEPAYILSNLPSKVALYEEAASVHGLSNFVQFRFSQVFHSRVAFQPEALDYLPGPGRANAIHIPESEFDSLVVWNINARDSRHRPSLPGLPLSLLVLWIGGADDTHHSLAAYDLALIAPNLDRSLDLHSEFTHLPVVPISRRHTGCLYLNL